MKNCSGAEELKKLLVEKMRINEQEVLNKDFGSKFVEGLSSPVRVQKIGNVINLTKCHSFADNASVDFEFSFRLQKNGTHIELWPISFQSVERGKLVAEMEMNGRRMVNTVIQSELVEIANTWGKGLAAQGFSRSLERSV